MQRFHQISLNAIRVFATAARHQSIAGAASVLGVTPSAVSHQIKNLEAALATALFVRSNNTITLTPVGQRYLDDISPALKMLEQASNALTRNANELTVRVSATLAVRWLIPALEGFKKQYPDARIRIETGYYDEARLGQAIDMAITYRRNGDEMIEGGSPGKSMGEKILSDFSRPVLSPALLQQSGYLSRKDMALVPAIICTENNWDWQQWARHFDVPIADMQFTDQFDMDDAALHAATAGLGMVLAPSLMTMTEINAGLLVVLPDVEPLELGAFYLISGPRTNGIIKSFRKWLLSELAAQPS
ncbi:MAG: transcriptional regulator [Hyphomicrobiales bacterium]|nr:MAG: transcriptional regulator [Hyphomicrobiales bacterium]